MKIAITAIIALLAVGGAVYYAIVAVAPSVPPRAEQTPTVQIGSPSLGGLSELVDATGGTEPRKHIDISARVSATILELPFDEGQIVTAGDGQTPPSLLVKLDDSDLRASLRSIRARRNAQEAQIRVAEAQIESRSAALQGLIASIEEATLDLERQTYLLHTQDVAQSTVDAARARLADLQAQLESTRKAIEADRLQLRVMQYNLEAADADISRAEEDLRHTTIHAPMSGVITRLNSEVGETVAGTIQNAGTVIMEIADLSDMLFIAHVDEADVGRIRVGQTAEIELQAYPDEPFTGTVETIALKHDQSPNGSKIFKTEIAMRLEGRRIYPGLTGDCRITVVEHENVLRAPTQAVLGRRIDELPADIRQNNPHVEQDKTIAAVVYRVIDEKTVVTPVSIGPSDATHTIITGGVTTEDRIVTGPYKVLESLQHDTKVIDEKEAAKTGGDKPADARNALEKAETAEPVGEPSGSDE